jgi:hypothetical protein
MYSEEQMNEIVRLINICKDLIDSEVYVYNEGNVFGIEYEGYQTLKLTVEPVFDMSENEISALINLMARALPITKHIIEESNRKEAKIEALLDAVSTISLIASEKIRRVDRIEIVESKDDQDITIGEK